MRYEDIATRKIHGWLLLFILSLSLLVPLGVLFVMASRFYGTRLDLIIWERPPLSAYRTVATALGALQVAASLFLAWRLVRARRWNTVRLAIIVLWIFGCGLALFEVAFLNILFGADDPLLLRYGWYGLWLATWPTVRTIIYCGVWTAYLLRSDQVAEIYGRPGHNGRLKRVFE